MKRSKKIRKAILSFFAVLILLVGCFCLLLYFKYGEQILNLKKTAETIARSSSEESFKASQTSLVYAEDGSILSVVKSEKETYYLPYESIPKAAIDAVLVTEDKKFFNHEGIDYLSNLRALLALLKNKGEIHQGGSTITQQLAKNVFLTNEVSVERKVTELFLAAELEKKYTKKQILEFYLNNIYYANGYYGIQAASNGYFNKGVAELSLSEIAFLSAIPNSPTYLNPLKYFSDTLERRDKILVQMYDDGVISLEDYLDATNETIELQEGNSEIHNYAESYTYYCTIRALMKAEGFEFQSEFGSSAEKEAYQEAYNEAYYRIQRQLYTKGYRIYTSLDMEKQEQLQAAVDENLSGFTGVSDAGVYKLQASAVCIDNDTGRVVAIIGGRSQESSRYTLNRAYQSFRQPGSSIKPLLIYTPMFERGYYPDTLVMDEKADDGPKNATNVYSGEITIRRAVESSKNTIAWQLLKELSPATALSYLYRLNFSHIVSDDYNLGISLGGFTYGASAVEMTAGFSCLENDGMYRTPTCIVKITDSEGNVIVSDEINEQRVYDTNAARMMTDVLTGVMKNGTGSRLAISGVTTAGKTGTTTDKKDGWFVGYSRYYTTGVWVGCDYPETISDLAGNTYPGYIWKDFMTKIHHGLVDKAFLPFVDDRPEETEETDETEEGEETPEDDTAGIEESAGDDLSEESADSEVNGEEAEGGTLSGNGTPAGEIPKDSPKEEKEGGDLNDDKSSEENIEQDENTDQDEPWDEEQWMKEQFAEPEGEE